MPINRTISRGLSLLLLCFVSSAFLCLPYTVSAKQFITLASTTSTDNSGLYQFILPKFTKKTGINVRVVAVGTGQALRIARNGDADVLIVHHRSSEEKFVADGYGIERFDLMYNDFILVGPKNDPARIKGLTGIDAALQKIASSKTLFVSRGDDSGTHKRELSLWRRQNIDPRRQSGTWYRETGSGMGATLNTAGAMKAYTLTDRGTWLAFKNRFRLVIVVERVPPLKNQYGVIRVNEKRHPHVKTKLAQKFIDWLLSPEGQAAIGSFRINGQVLFTPNAKSGPTR
ncbi:MAG: substrate-binding domain-containing protein [Rhodospirillaceae bacterium]|jgi:tungstate transport system substrate-binding protein